jgi:hypothetical protein
VLDVAAGARLYLRYVIIQHGFADGKAGALAGGIQNRGYLYLAGATVRDNVGIDGASGGAYNSGIAEFSRVTVSGNSAGAGGLGGGIQASGGMLSLSNTTISGNQAAGDGGGIATASGSVATLNNVTIADNVANAGGGIAGLSAGPTDLSNTLIGRNTARSGDGADCLGTLTSRGYNLIQNPSGCTIPRIEVGNLDDKDLLLGPLADNPGPPEMSQNAPPLPQTHALLPQSPAIDAGNPTPWDWVDFLRPCERWDARHVERAKLPRCDVGAFELTGP